MDYKLAVSGSRLFLDYEIFQQKIRQCVKQYGLPKMIIHGGAEGADTMATIWARDNGVEYSVMRPQYKNKEMITKYGKTVWGRVAPLERNKDIVNACDILLAFPLDDTTTLKSNGTNSTISHAQKEGKLVLIHPVPPTQVNL